MALTSTITAKLYPPIGLVGQSVGFVDFTANQLASDGYISTLTRKYEFEANNILAAIVDPTLGKEAIVGEIQAQVEAYLGTVFTDVASTYVAKIYILNARRVSMPIVGVADADANSPFVERVDTFYVDVRINVSVA